jgi:hypothetical protein
MRASGGSEAPAREPNGVNGGFARENGEPHEPETQQGIHLTTAKMVDRLES